MAKVTDFNNQSWVIEGYDSATLIERNVLPFSQASEKTVIRMIEEKAKTHLTATEVLEKPQLWLARKDEVSGNRITYSAGENPHYVAGLWRSDELKEKAGDA